MTNYSTAPVGAQTQAAAGNANLVPLRRLDFQTKGSKWYEGTDFEKGYLVTSESHNADLHIDSIKLSEPNGKNNARIVADVYVTMADGLVAFGGAIWTTKDGTGFTFSVERRTYTKENGETGYVDSIRLGMAVTAQILRYAESKRIEQPVPWNVETNAQATQPAPANQAQYATNQGQYAPQGQAQPVYTQGQQFQANGPVQNGGYQNGQPVQNGGLPNGFTTN